MFKKLLNRLTCRKETTSNTKVMDLRCLSQDPALLSRKICGMLIEDYLAQLKSKPIGHREMDSFFCDLGCFERYIERGETKFYYEMSGAWTQMSAFADFGTTHEIVLQPGVSLTVTRVKLDDDGVLRLR